MARTGTRAGTDETAIIEAQVLMEESEVSAHIRSTVPFCAPAVLAGDSGSPARALAFSGYPDALGRSHLVVRPGLLSGRLATLSERWIS